MAKGYAESFYASKPWKETRGYIMKRDHYRCQEKGCERPAVEVHHIRPITPANIGDPNITLNPDNLIALCYECHKARHRNLEAEKGVQLTKYFFDSNGELRENPPGGNSCEAGPDSPRPLIFRTD